MRPRLLYKGPKLRIVYIKGMFVVVKRLEVRARYVYLSLSISALLHVASHACCDISFYLVLICIFVSTLFHAHACIRTQDLDSVRAIVKPH